ncbi:MAG: hypothetical protein RMM53_12780, partial [Bacteroidia bacterium]|nr:hypothetical protein [Bacteroidia bacterium]
IGGASGDDGAFLAPDADGIWITGSFRGTAGFIEDVAQSRGSADVFAMKISTAGRPMALTTLGSTATETAKTLMVTTDGPIVAFTYGGTVAVGGQSIPALSAPDALIARLCSSSIVWPGDADNNGTVNIADFFLTASGYGIEGAPRPIPSSQWTAQIAGPYWPQSVQYKNFPLNFLRLDANGDGTINLFDVALSIAHRGLSRP